MLATGANPFWTGVSAVIALGVGGTGAFLTGEGVGRATPPGPCASAVSLVITLSRFFFGPALGVRGGVGEPPGDGERALVGDGLLPLMWEMKEAAWVSVATCARIKKEKEPIRA